MSKHIIEGAQKGAAARGTLLLAWWWLIWLYWRYLWANGSFKIHNNGPKFDFHNFTKNILQMTASFIFSPRIKSIQAKWRVHYTVDALPVGQTEFNDTPHNWRNQRRVIGGGMTYGHSHVENVRQAEQLKLKSIRVELYFSALRFS